jgi:hypothetical protein
MALAPDSRSDLKPMGDGKIKLKPAMQGRRVHALHIHEWIYGSKQIAQNAGGS